MKTGSLVFITIGTKLMVGETSLTLNTATDLIETSNKLNGRGTGFEYGRIRTTISVSSVEDITPVATKMCYADLYALIAAGTKPAILITRYTDKTGVTDVVGDSFFSGTAVISDISADYPDNAMSTLSCNMTIDGDLTTGVNT